MSQPYVGEIRMFAGNFAPAGWMLCQGQLLPISEYETLFNLIGTTYGGDGQNTFQLPDLRGRAPVHVGPSFALGQLGGAESVTLTTSQIPAHSHQVMVNNANGTSGTPGNNVLAAAVGANPYKSTAPSVAMNPSAVKTVGGSQPHDNMQPFLVINYIISLFGVYPSQS